MFEVREAHCRIAAFIILRDENVRASGTRFARYGRVITGQNGGNDGRDQLRHK